MVIVVIIYAVIDQKKIGNVLSTFGWAKYADTNIGLDQFGASAPAKDVFKKFGFTVDALVALCESIK